MTEAQKRISKQEEILATYVHERLRLLERFLKVTKSEKTMKSALSKNTNVEEIFRTELKSSETRLRKFETELDGKLTNVEDSTQERSILQNLQRDLASARKKQLLILLELMEVANEQTYKLALSGPPNLRFFEQQNDFLLQGENVPSSVADQASVLSNLSHVKVTNGEFEKALVQFFDHVSTKRMAEEMDSVTYNNRMLGFLRRARSQVSDMGRALKAFQCEQISVLLGDLPWIISLGEYHRNREVSWTEHELERWKSADQLSKACRRFLFGVDQILERVGVQCRQFEVDYCSGYKLERLTKQTAKVSRKIEAGGLIRHLWPAVATVLCAFAVLRVLSLDISLIIKEWVFAIVLLTMVVIYSLSSAAGKRFRSSFIKRFQIVLIRNANQIFAAPKSGIPQLVDSLTPANVQFSSGKFDIELNSSKHGFVKMGKFPGFWAKVSDFMAMLFKNVVMIAAVPILVLVLSAFGSTFDPKAQKVLISNNANLDRCRLRVGRILISKNNRYLVVPSAKPFHQPSSSQGTERESFFERLDYALRIGIPHVFSQPQMNVISIARDNVQLLDNADSRISKNLPDCGEEVAKPTIDAKPIIVQFDKAIELKHTSQELLFKLDKLTSSIGSIALPNPCCLAPPPKPDAARSFVNVVAPIVVDTSVSANGTTEVPNFSSNLITHLIINGQSENLYGGKRFVLLPFFPDNVTAAEDTRFRSDGVEGISSAREAYYFGLTSLRDPKVPSEENMTFVERVGHALKVCVQANKAAQSRLAPNSSPKKVFLSVLGYASQTPFISDDRGSNSYDLNHFLAEGRRAAVINVLVNALGEDLDGIEFSAGIPSYEPRILKDEKLDISTLMVDQGTFHFEHHSAMANSLAGWLNQPKLGKQLEQNTSDSNKVNSNSLKEIFARSVVLVFEGDDLTSCGKSPDQLAKQ